MKTVITHFYNEEYLLPRWLEHHKKIFDFGVLIDYGSTDNSRAICHEICPHWQVFQSAYGYFDAIDCDKEVMFYERQIQGWRIALNTTEFLMTKDIDAMTPLWGARMQWFIPCIRFTKWDPTGSLDPNKPLWEQITTGVNYNSNPVACSRSLHNFNDIDYKMADGSGSAAGRHFTKHNTEDMLIFHYAHCIVGEPMIKRRLQIQNMVSPRDRREQLGTHHYIDNQGLNLDRLNHMHSNYIAVGESDCSEYIKRVTI